ncbi:MAG: hypothetical protein DDT23_00966 [candidate division WS2 bacterium]|nr:hypothetical protein [Candidatus Lithacetigena glycinireducens]
MAKTFNRSIKLVGEPQRVGAIALTVLEYDVDNNITKATGITVPTGGSAGYAGGCIFVRAGGGLATTLFINEGSERSANFTAVVGNAIIGAAPGERIVRGLTPITGAGAIATGLTTITGYSVCCGSSGTALPTSTVSVSSVVGGTLNVVVTDHAAAANSVATVARTVSWVAVGT